MTSSSDPTQLSVRELCEPRPKNGPYSTPIEGMRNEMDGQNDEADRAGDGDGDPRSRPGMAGGGTTGARPGGGFEGKELLFAGDEPSEASVIIFSHIEP